MIGCRFLVAILVVYYMQTISIDAFKVNFNKFVPLEATNDDAEVLQRQPDSPSAVALINGTISEPKHQNCTTSAITEKGKRSCCCGCMCCRPCCCCCRPCCCCCCNNCCGCGCGWNWCPSCCKPCCCGCSGYGRRRRLCDLKQLHESVSNQANTRVAIIKSS